MASRKPLKPGDDGSGNRYPVREEAAYFAARFPHASHVLSGVAHADCSECVPASLQVPTPERHEPPCLADCCVYGGEEALAARDARRHRNARAGGR